MPPWMIGCSMPNRSVIAVFTESSWRVVALTDFGSMNDFEKAGGAHAAADAHGDDCVFRLAPAAFDQRVAGQARAGHAVGMADRDRTAIDVEFLGIDAE